MEDFFVDKTEAEWDAYLRCGDRYAELCLNLMRRFQELPDGEEYVKQKLEEAFRDERILDSVPSWELNDEQNRFSAENETDEGDENQEEFNPMSGDPQNFLWADTHAKRQALDNLLRYARHAMECMHQSLLDWCNICGLVLAPSQNVKGMQILFLISRAVSDLDLGMNGLSAQRSYCVVSIIKRSLHETNQCLALLSEVMKGTPENFVDLLNKPREHLLSAVDDLVTLISLVRKIVGTDTAA